MKVRFELATDAHARLVAAQMRARDQAEIQAGWNLSPQAAIQVALWDSPRYARTMFYGLEPLAIFGLANLSILGSSAQVWCFGTTAIDRHPLVFARASKRALIELHSYAPILTNLVDASDESALRWLAFLGATYVLQPEARGGRLFGQFILARQQESQCQQA